MQIIYEVVLDNIQYNISIHDYPNRIELEACTLNTVPILQPVALGVSKTLSIFGFIKAYEEWFQAVHNEFKMRISTGSVEVSLIEDLPPTTCADCAYWGNPEDTKSELRVCRFWDIPERECLTGRYEHCSKGYAPRSDDILKIERIGDFCEGFNPPISPIFETAKPLEVPDDGRHTYLKSYLDSICKEDSPNKAVADAFTTIWDALKPRPKDIDKSTKK